jgi:hypothetical protein
MLQVLVSVFFLRVEYVEAFQFRDPYASDPTHSYLSKDHFVS